MSEKLGQFLGEILGHALRVAAPTLAEVAAGIYKKLITSTIEESRAPQDLKTRLTARIPKKL